MDVVDLAIKMTADADDAAAGFDKVGSSALSMADDVDRAAGEADKATRDMAGGVDALGSSSSQAAGGVGDLGGALALMPGPLGALGAGMEAAAPAIMGVTGATDLLSLATQSNIVVTAKARAATIAKAVADRASGAAAKVAAVGQWALNAALAANPIGLVIAAVLVLVGLFVLAYKRSETFRAVVDGAMKGASKAVGWVTEKLQAVVDKVDDALEPIGGLGGAVEKIGTLGKAAFELWLTPLRTVIGLVESLIDWISKIDFPDKPGWLGGRVAAGGTTAAGGGLPELGPRGGVMLVTINGAVDKVGTARQLMDLARSYGVTVQGVPV